MRFARSRRPVRAPENRLGSGGGDPYIGIYERGRARLAVAGDGNGNTET